MTLDEVLNNSTYIIYDGLYNVAKTEPYFKGDGCFLITKDEIETTVIYEHSLKFDGIVEEKKDYVLVGINVAVPFYAPGFIAKISSEFANNGISVLVISTYSRDYFLVSIEFKDMVDNVLGKLGIKPTQKEAEDNGTVV